MKTLLFTFLLFLPALQAQSTFRFYINNINLPINNSGTLADVNIPPDGSIGRYLGVPFLFSGGFFLSGYNGDTLWANAQASASLIENYRPGNVDSNRYDPRYKIYVVNESDQPFGPSWQEWIFAVGIGADFYDGDNDGDYNPIDLNGNGEWDIDEDRPDIIGDQIVWCVYNDGQPGNQRTRFAGVEPQGIEIQQTVFGYNSNSAPQLKNVLFIRYKIINKGTVNPILDSVYFSAWTDPDIGDHSWNDLAGCDTLSSSALIYNAGPDTLFAVSPPAFFVNLLQKPHSYIPGETFIDNNSNGTYEDSIDTPLDTAYNHQGLFKGIQIFPGAKNLSMSSSTSFLKSDPLNGDPSDEFDARNYMLGKHSLGYLLDPCTWILGEVRGGVDCNLVNPLYWYSGDPEDDTGWLSVSALDYRIMAHTGPFSLEENKPITIIVGYTIGQGDDPLNSVTVGKEVSAFVHQFYQSNFDYNILPVEDESNLIVDDYKLFQNYPNPFNPSTTISYQIPQQELVIMKVFDILGNEIGTIVNEEKPAGNYKVDFNTHSLPSGVYFYQLVAGNFVETKKMVLMK